MEEAQEKVNTHHLKAHKNTAAGAVYGMGLIGALVYFLSHATTFWVGAYGVFQAIVWPAYLIYYAFEKLAH